MANNTDQEPSIEEILTSIRQIISDDDDDETDAAQPAVASEPESELEDEDIIELTEKADPAPAATNPEPEPPEPEPEEIFEPEPEPESAPKAEEVMEIDMQDAESDEEFSNVADDDFDSMMDNDLSEPDFSEDQAQEETESILTKKAEDAAYSGFKRLAAKTAVDTISGVTIEEIVRDELRPMLRVWLDQNLPDIVERLVQEELDRVAKRALED